MTQELDLRLSTGASVWDAWTYGCMKNCPRGPDCPCLPYKMGDVPPRYPVPATSLYYDGPKHVAVAYQLMVHLIKGNHDLIRSYWTR